MGVREKGWALGENGVRVRGEDEERRVGARVRGEDKESIGGSEEQK